MDTPPNYSPLTNDYDSPSYNITQDPHIIQDNIIPKENNPNKNSGEYIIYKTPYDCGYICIFILLIIFIIISLLFAIFAFLNFDGIQKYIFFVFPLICFLCGLSCTSVYYIIYDSSKKRILLKGKKIFSCIAYMYKIQINEIQKVTIEKYADETNYRFRIDFILNDGNKVIAVDYSDKGVELAKALQSLKSVLPEEINFEEVSENVNKKNFY